MAVREKRKLGDLLVEAGALSAAQLKAALERQRHTRKKLGEAIIDLELLTEEAILQTLARQLRIDLVDLDALEPDFDILKKIPEATARKYALLPLGRAGNHVHIAMADPLNIFAIDEIAIKLEAEVKVSIAREGQIAAAITRHYGVTSSIREALRSVQGAEEVREEAAVPYLSAVPREAAPVAKLLETIVRQAARDRASDIHIEPDEEDVKIRTRIDGVLFANAPVPKALQAALISRAKVLGRMDIAESRLPQDGRFQMEHEGREIECRVSAFPTIHGENVVMRILRKDAALTKLEDTGLRGATLERALGMFRAPFGIIVVTGPTGSGKTTTLYAALNRLNTVERHIITIEDPVEYRVPGVRQAQVNPKAGLTFASSMRSILRQDPDVIMVGEIRDRETAEIAMQAAMTGHLVLSTLHANDAPGAVVRLVDIGIEPYMISSALAGAIAQRLVRRVCSGCAGAGCMECRKSGYAGRIGIFEALVLDEPARALVNGRASASALREYAVQHLGMETMRRDGVEKTKRGITTAAEVNRVTADC
ncbi:MAG: Flp pilus assembly complex ATPase component TadA [Nitrospinae bacterium]|nr:Flp pilus assembly complex ATPase component TadA [Nitrospinota bacterium]